MPCVQHCFVLISARLYFILNKTMSYSSHMNLWHDVVYVSDKIGNLWYKKLAGIENLK